MGWHIFLNQTLYLPNNNMSPAVPQWCSSRLSASRCVPPSADGQVYLGPGSGLQRPPLSTIITSACSGVPAWQQSSASALQHSALGLGHGMMKVRVSAVVSVVVWQLQLFLALNYTFDCKVNDWQISEIVTTFLFSNWLSDTEIVRHQEYEAHFSYPSSCLK